jgi:hypothetical protein
MKLTMRKLCDEIARQLDDSNGPGSFIVSLIFKEKPKYEHHELMRAVQRYLPEVGIETIHDFVPGKDCYYLEWKVHH